MPQPQPPTNNVDFCQVWNTSPNKRHATSPHVINGTPGVAPQINGTPAFAPQINGTPVINGAPTIFLPNKRYAILPPNKQYASGSDKTQVINGTQIYPLINGMPANQKFPTLYTAFAVYLGGLPPVLASFSGRSRAHTPPCRRNLKKSGQIPPAGPSAGGDFPTFSEIRRTHGPGARDLPRIVFFRGGPYNSL